MVLILAQPLPADYPFTANSLEFLGGYFPSKNSPEKRLSCQNILFLITLLRVRIRQKLEFKHKAAVQRPMNRLVVPSGRTQTKGTPHHLLQIPPWRSGDEHNQEASPIKPSHKTTRSTHQEAYLLAPCLQNTVQAEVFFPPDHC